MLGYLFALRTICSVRWRKFHIFRIRVFLIKQHFQKGILKFIEENILVNHEIFLQYIIANMDYLRRPYTLLDGYILLSAAIYYFWRVYTTFDGYILLLALPDCDFVRIQDFPAISRICGLKTRLEFNINLLALIQFCFFCSSMVNIWFRSTLSLIKQIIKEKNKIR